MKHYLILTTLSLLAAPLLAGDAGVKEDILNAAKKLAEKPNYSWKTTVVVPESAQFKPGPTEGKTDKEGTTYVTMSFGDNLTEAVIKGEKAVVTNQEGEWQSAADLENAEGRGRFLGRMVRNLKTPAVQAADLANATKDWQKDKDSEGCSGTLTEEGAKALFRFGTVSGAKGTVTFWAKDGVLSKYEFKVQGKVDFNGNETEVDRATTVQIKDIGTTKVNVPEAARKKLG